MDDGEQTSAFPFAGSIPSGRGGQITPASPLPVTGSVEIAMPVERLWEVFLDVPGWADWNPCIHTAKTDVGVLREGAELIWSFNAIKPAYLYKLPAKAEIVECVPNDRVTWEVSAPGFHALHSYRFAEAGPDRCRFGSWEVAEGPTYRALRRFWIAHFRFVCRESLAGAASIDARRA